MIGCVIGTVIFLCLSYLAAKTLVSDYEQEG